MTEIPITRPWFGPEEAAAAARPFAGGWIAQGPEVAAFEAELAAVVEAPHCCAVANGTAALHLALLACGVGPGDEVVTASASYIATANAVRHCGAVPVFVDVDARYGNLAADGVAAAIGPKTKAVLVVHQLGMPAELPALLEIARRAGVALVEDAACALGSTLEGAPIGRPHGDVATFSFHPRKVITTGEGGAVVTRDAELDARVRALRQHGRAPGSRAHALVGFNYRMTDVQAAVGRVQLGRLPEILARRRAIAEAYGERLRMPGVIPPSEPAWGRSCWQSYQVELDGGRDAVAAAMGEMGVATRPGVECAHLEAAYADGEGMAWRRSGSLEVSEHRHRQGLMLPLYPQMTDAEVARVVEALAAALDRR